MRVFVLAALLVGAGVLAYHNTFLVPFTFDDRPAIVDNATIRQFATALSPPDSGGSTTGRPLVNLSFALNYRVSGEAVWSYHALNLCIHLGAGLALFGLVRRTLLLPAMAENLRLAAHPLALVVSLLWIVHPLQTESVTSVVQRTESLVGLFYLFTLYSFVRASAPSPRARGWMVVSAIACLLGMATKEVMVTAPVLVLLYDRTFVAGTWREVWRQRRGYYGILACTWLLLGWLVFAGGGTRGEAAGFGLGVTAWNYALTQCRAILLYLKLALWPHPLVFDYGTDIVRNAGDVWRQGLVLLLLLSATVIALWRRPKLGFLGAWFFMILAPSSSVVPLVSQTIAEHRMYLPLAAVITIVVVTAYVRLGRAAWVGALLVSPLLLVLTVVRNLDYRSEVALWTDTVAKAPGNARAHLNLAEFLIDDGRPDAALAPARTAVRLRPDFAEGQTNLGIALAQLGRTAEALEPCRRAVELQPDYARGRSNYGIVLAQLGRWPEAIAEFEAALRLTATGPDAVSIRRNLAQALLQAGRAEEAVAQFTAVVQAAPGSAELHFQLAVALGLSGRLDESVAQLQTVLRLDPGHARARQALDQAHALR